MNTHPSPKLKGKCTVKPLLISHARLLEGLFCLIVFLNVIMGIKTKSLNWITEVSVKSLNFFILIPWSSCILILQLGHMNTFHEITSRLWIRDYDFPAISRIINTWITVSKDGKTNNTLTTYILFLFVQSFLFKSAPIQTFPVMRQMQKSVLPWRSIKFIFEIQLFFCQQQHNWLWVVYF